MRIFKSPLYRIVNCDVTPVAISDRRSVDNTLDDDDLSQEEPRINAALKGPEGAFIGYVKDIQLYFFKYGKISTLCSIALSLPPELVLEMS